MTCAGDWNLGSRPSWEPQASGIAINFVENVLHGGNMAFSPFFLFLFLLWKSDRQKLIWQGCGFNSCARTNSERAAAWLLGDTPHRVRRKSSLERDGDLFCRPERAHTKARQLSMNTYFDHFFFGLIFTTLKSFFFLFKP